MTRTRIPPKRIVALVLTLLMAVVVQRLSQEGQWSQFDTPVFFLLAGVIFSVFAADEQDGLLGKAFFSIALFFAVLSYIDFRFLGR